MRLPYGVSHFPSIREQNQVFIDHTDYIRRLEDNDAHLMFLRPRRFGKSLWISILEHYYDIRFADQFEALFGNLAIGNEPTNLRNSFLTMVFDFSAVDVEGDEKQLRSSLFDIIKEQLKSFVEDHRPWLTDVDTVLIQLETSRFASSAVRLVFNAVKKAKQKVYLLIDEYDNFTNELIASRRDKDYLKLVKGTGTLKTFFKALKESTRSGIVSRTFMTGVNPLLLDDLTSGFNIATNLSMDEEFTGMLGFTHQEVQTLLEYAVEPAEKTGVTATLPSNKELTSLLTSWYDGYRFSVGAAPMFNPDMILYALRAIMRGTLPKEILDPNLKTDLNKIDLVVRKAGDTSRLLDLMNRNGRIHLLPKSTFGLTSMADPDNFHSLLYYLGMLTFDERIEPTMRIPNYVARTLYWSEMEKILAQDLSLDAITSLKEALQSLMREGQGEPFFRLILEQVISQIQTNDFRHFNETSVKSIILSFTSLSPHVMAFSEWPTEQGLIDLVLVPMPNAPFLPHAWIVELKYLKQSEDSPAARETKLQEAREQLARYQADEKRMAYLSRFQLHSAIALFIDGNELVWVE